MPDRVTQAETQKARLIRRRKERDLCYRCGKRPPEGGFQICNACSVEWRKRRLLHKDRYNSVHRASRKRVKREAFEAYGGPHCVCCSQSHEEFLTIDHIRGGGNSHRRQLEMEMHRGNEFYQWLKKNDYPQGYQVLCMNCNLAKRESLSCPHQRKTKPLV
jgi:hypothetical protein